MIELTYIQEAALKPSGNAAAVKRTYNYQNRCPLQRLTLLTEANSYDLAFQVDRRWQRNKLSLVRSWSNPGGNMVNIYSTSGQASER